MAPHAKARIVLGAILLVGLSGYLAWQVGRAELPSSTAESPDRPGSSAKLPSSLRPAVGDDPASSDASDHRVAAPTVAPIGDGSCLLVRGAVLADLPRPVPILGEVFVIASRATGMSNANTEVVARVPCALDGSFEISVPDEELWLEAEAVGYLAGERCLLRSAAEPAADDSFEDLRLFLDPSVVVTGVVLAAPGRQTVDGVTVRIGRPSARPRLAIDPRVSYLAKRWLNEVTESGGRFRSTLPRLGPWRFEASHQDGRRGERSVPRLDSTPIEIELLPAEASPRLLVHGIVLDPIGRPVAGAEVRSNSGGGSKTEAGEHGRFELPIDDVDHPWSLLACADEFAPGVAQFEAGDPARLEPVELRLESPLRVAGRLRHRDGRPLDLDRSHWVGLRGAPRLVGKTGSTPSALSVCGRDRVQCGDDGRFVFEGVGEGDYFVAYYPSGRPDEAAYASAASGQADVELLVGEVRGPSVRFELNIRNAIDGARVDGTRIDGARVVAKQHRAASNGIWVGGEVAAAKISPTGDAVLEVMFSPQDEAAQFSLSVAAAGYAEWSFSRRPFERGVYRFDVEWWPERSLRVKVFGTDGEPASGAKVEIWDGERRLMIRTSRGRATSRVTVDRRGEVVAHGMPAKALRLRVWVDTERDGVREQSVNLRQAVEHQVDVWLER